MKHPLVVALGLAAVASLSASMQRTSPPSARPATRPPATRTERAAPFRVGETLTYDVSWSSYLTAGTAVTTVKEKRPSFASTAYYIVAEGRPTTLLSKIYSLYYKMDTLLDSYTLLPQRGSIYSQEGTRHRFRVTRFDRTAQRAFFEFQSTTTMKSDFAVPPYTQDALSAIYVLRAVPFKVGERMTMPVSDDGKTYRLQIDVSAPERLKTPFGETSAWRLRPTIFDDTGRPQGRNMGVWISDDARRLPMKFQVELPVGSFNLVLRDAR